MLNNKFLWFIAVANAFVYMVRYGCLDWAPTILTEKGIDLKGAVYTHEQLLDAILRAKGVDAC